jgi:hypothetical protein
MIAADLSGAEKVQNRLREWPQTMRGSLAGRLRSLAHELKDLVTDNKLGGEVLHARTGTLRASVFAAVAESPGGVTLSLGSDVPYAAFQEFGFSGSEAVREHLRRITTAFGRPIRTGARDVLVRAYTRRLAYPRHSFLSRTLRGQQTAMVEDLRQALAQTASAVLG